MKPTSKPYNGKPEYNNIPVIYAVMIVIISLWASDGFTNETLKNSASPYVAMHAEDAVQWSEWESSVLARAKKENKPIFITLGYFSCYWCHVLQRESFKSEGVAKLLNERFISVVVDRELHPVLDARLMAFAEKTIGRGGWPLNVVITPDGYPFMATIYLPEKNFQSWLGQVYGLWETDPEYIRTIAQDAANEMNFNFSLKKDEITDSRIKKITKVFQNEILKSFDEMEGGFGDSAKFPLSAILQSSLTLYEKNQNLAIKEQIQLTLKNMYERGLYDHLQGGFFRYTTDPSWQIPHFEKMLYDNAQLAALYFRAGKVFGDTALIEIAKQTLDFMLEYMQAPAGGFYGSFSAIDEKGVEGGYYVFEQETWQHLLSPDEEKVISLAWGWSNPSSIAEGFLPLYSADIELVARQAKLSHSKVQQLINSSKEKLLSIRNKRILPRDEKILASWNALTLLALIDGYQASGLQKYKTSAAKLMKFLRENLLAGGKLHRSSHRGLLAGNAGLEDYALVALAMERWMGLTGEQQDKKRLEELLNYAWMNFFSDTGWKMSDDLLIPYGASEVMLADGPMPSASGILIELGLSSKDQQIKAKAINALQIGHNILLSQPFWFASHVSLLMKSNLSGVLSKPGL